MPLPSNQGPWSHIDFITDLPESVTWWSWLLKTSFPKPVQVFQTGFLKRISFPSLPTAFKTNEVIFNQVYLFYIMPKEIVSDRGAQLMSTFMEKLVSIRVLQQSITQVEWSIKMNLPRNKMFLEDILFGKSGGLGTLLLEAIWGQKSLCHISMLLTSSNCF